MLEEMIRTLEIFQDYEWIFKTNLELEDTIVKAFGEMVKFWALVIQYLRTHPAGNLVVSLCTRKKRLLRDIVNIAFEPIVASEFNMACQKIHKEINHIKERPKPVLCTQHSHVST
jgi:hypothetical protein